MSYGNISAVLTDTDKQAIKDKVAEILALLPFLVNLTVGERREISKLGNKRFAFVQKAVQHANDHPAVFPSYFDVGEFNQDFDLFKDLQEIQAVLNSLLEKIDDTRLAVGGESYAAALQAKALFTEANRNEPGLDVIVDELEEFFKRSAGEGNGTDGTTEEPAPEA